MNNQSRKIDYTKTHFSEDEINRIKREVEIVRTKYPNNIPVVVKTKDKLQLSKTKYLVPADLTVGQFMNVIRKKLENPLDSSHALYIFVNNCLPQTSSLMSMLYENGKDQKTGMLFVTLCRENTFG